MAAENKPNSNNQSKKRKQRYLPHNKPVKKGSYPLHSGVQGFFITCDGGRERQASNEAINLLDGFYEELLHGEGCGAKHLKVPSKPLNKKIIFADSDSSGSDDESDPHKEDTDNENQADENEDKSAKKQWLETDTTECGDADCDKAEENPIDKLIENQNEDKSAKKQRLETDATKCGGVDCNKTEEKSIDKLIEDELKELGDRNKRRFASLDSGCNGVVFIKMHKRAGDPGPAEIVQSMMTSAASTRKHMSRFILRVLPVEVTCYASEEEISKAVKPLIAQHFPTEAPTPQKFAVLYEARANSGIERMTIINLVAKSVPGPHKVDLSNPDKTIIVQIAKTICLVGVVERYKELSKYNLRQLTSPTS